MPPGRDDRPASPTLLVGLGAFGKEVLAAVRGREPSRENLAGLAITIGPATPQAEGLALDPEAARPFEPIVAAAQGELAGMLELGRFVASTSPADPRGPHCDVLVVADLGEARVAPVVAGLCAALAEGMRRAFSAILRSGDGALCVCPLLFCPRTGERTAMAAAARALADGDAESDARLRLGGRIYLVEDQSGKYLIARPEMVRTFAAFLSAILLSGARDDDLGLRRLIESHGPERAFSTFACASLVFDHESLGRVAAARLGREILSVFRAAVDPASLDVAARAAALVPERTRLEGELAPADAIDAQLAPPALDVPTIEWEDSPETIVERKFGSLFRARTEAAIDAFRDEIERSRMDRLAAGIEQRGFSTLSEVEETLREATAALVAEGPTGHARALLVLRDALARARAGWAEVVRAVEAPELSALPPSPLPAKLAALHEAAASRPRPFRMAVLGGVGALIAGLMLAGAMVAGYRGLLHPDPLFFDALAPLPEGRLRPFFTWPVPLLLGSAMGAWSTGYRLWKHRKRHHVWVGEARDELSQALARHLREGVVGHFETRLAYTRLLWVQRIVGRVMGRLEETIAALEAVRAALGEADRTLAAMERAAERRLAGGERGSVLLASVVGSADLDAVYAELKPPEVMAAADRHLRESLKARPWTEAPFAESQRILDFCRRELVDLATMSPFEEGRTALHRAAAGAVRDFLEKLALKLSPPLEVTPAAAPLLPPPTRLLFVPPEARRLVESVLSSAGLEPAWEVRPVSGDPHRIHLLLAREGIPFEALSFARGQEEEEEARP